MALREVERTVAPISIPIPIPNMSVSMIETFALSDGGNKH